MGSISSRHFALIKRIPGLTLPVVLQVKDANGKRLGDAVLDQNGEVTANWLTPPRKFDNPSALRQALISRNSKTYCHFFYQGRSLEDHGVC